MSLFNFKKLLLKKIKTVLVIGWLLFLFQLSFGVKKILAASYIWNQTDWSEGTDISSFPSHTSNQNGWTKYFSKDSTIKTDTGLITLSPILDLKTQTSDSDFGLGTTVSMVISGSGNEGKIMLGDGGDVSVTMGSDYACSNRTDGTVYCWGGNSQGQLGIGSTIGARSYPVQVVGAGGTGILEGITSVKAGTYSTCGLKNDKTVYCWGNDDNGQLGDNLKIDKRFPVKVLGMGGTGILDEVSAISLGGNSTFAVKDNGEVYSWGKNNYAQLGIGNTVNPKITIMQVVGAGGTGVLSDVKAITSGESHSCVVKNDGTVYCWGYGFYGELGIGVSGANSIVQYPTQVTGLTNIVSIAAGTNHTCAIDSSGKMYCWGRNTNGQLGNNSSANSASPVQVKSTTGSGTFSTAATAAAGGNHTCTISTDDKIYCWGLANYGQLGVGSTGFQIYPKQVVGVDGSGVLDNIKSAELGTFSTCAGKNNGEIYCWGENSNGQLGINNNVGPKISPVQTVGTGGSGTFSAGIYAPSGSFTSSIIDLGQKSNLTTLSFGSDIPTNTALKFQIRSANTNEEISTADWYGPTGISDYYTSTGTNINSDISGKNYVQYKAFFESDLVNSPTLNEVAINYSYYQSGSLVSSPFNSNNLANLLSNISWIKATPTDTATKFQIKTASTSDGLIAADWKGPDGTNASYFSNNLGETTPTNVRDGLSDQWIQYKAFLNTDDSSISPTLYDVSLTYVVNAPPVFNNSYGTNGLEVTAGEPGWINFSYSVGDTDTDQGSAANKYKLWPTFQYSTDNGENWTTIESSNLTGPSQDSPITLTSPSTYKTETTLWHLENNFTNTYDTIKIKMIIDDHEAANNTANLVTDAFIVDTKLPEIGTPDGGGNGININKNVTTALAGDKTNDRNVVLYFSATDDSSLKMKYSTDASFIGSTYIDYVSSIGFTLASGDGSKRIYVKFKDYFGNETESYSDVIQLDTTSPNKPTSLLLQDVSNASISEYKLFLNWAKNNEADWMGYKIYRSTNGTDYDWQQTINNVNTNYSLDIGVTNGSNYFYKVTAIDDLNNESIGSTVFQVVGGSPIDSIAPTISNIQISEKTTSSITVSWTTNEVSNSTILYSTNTNFDNSQGSSGYLLHHSVTLAGLTAGTTYNFKVRSSDPSGNAADSTADDFTTNPADVTGPTISNIDSGNITDSSVIITFVTDEESSSFVEYSTISGFSSGSIVGQNDAEINHSIKISSLSPSMTYFYKVRSSDNNGNETISVEKSLVTATNDSDRVPPVISSNSISNIKYNTATISFTTDEKASSFVEFGKTTSYGRIYGIDESVLTHSVTLPYDLKPESIYYYRVRSKDNSGNESIGLGSSFTTAADPEDLAAPIISTVNAGEPGKNSATITWTTNEVADSYVGFSEDLTYLIEQGKPTMTTDHSITLVGLKPKTKYYFRIKSADPSDNLTTDNNNSEGYTFVTADGENPPTIFANQIRNVGSSSAEVYWETNVNSNSYVEYGLDESYGYWSGLNNLETEHRVQLTNLLSAATYNFRVRSKSNNDSEAVSQNFTLTTEGIAVTAVGTTTITVINPSESSILDSIKNGTVDFIKKVLNIIPETSISEGDFVDTMNSMSPKIVSSPAISAGNITIEPGVDKIVISWKTDKSASSVVAYASDKEFNKDNPDYPTTVGNPDELVTNHSVEIINLNPNTTYHYQVRSKAALGNWTKSSDYTFTTLSINSEIKDLKFNEIGEKSISASWQTTFEARSMMEIIDILTGKTVVKKEENSFDRNHNFKTSELQTSTNYKLKLVTVAKDGTVSEESIYPFATSTSSNPPEISNVRISNALISGAVEQVQTIISWKTDKPSTSKIIYDEGTAKELKLSTGLDKSLVTDHIVVTTTLKPGKVYKFKAESADSNGISSLSKDYIIMTPKAQESVINLIIDNFTQSFSFITRKGN
ncbi:MAG: fibronectin type III domain-containing protein [Candidatus Shapirobacteria bacterium]|nr:fibronectin type III domain-containing protein [Candidatus Shapirobacteria bacterium]MDD4410815.1 fibronectin type III domain-containing protein [Candidatus Shapirobacteria bacterium]